MTHLIDLVQHYGLAFVFVNVLLLQAGLPVPAYPTLIVTGALAARSPYTLAGLVATAVVGVGDRQSRLVLRRPQARRPRAEDALPGVAVARIRACGRRSRSSSAGARRR